MPKDMIDEMDAELRKQSDARYIKLNDCQLLALMTTILVAGKCFRDQTTESVHDAITIATEIFDRVVCEDECTDRLIDRQYPPGTR